MHFLLGALVGGAVFALGYAVCGLIRGEELTWERAGAAFIGGAVTGLLAATTLGTSLLAGGGLGAFGASAAGGAIGSGTAQVAENAFEDRPIFEDVPEHAALGAITAPIFYGTARGLSRWIRPQLGTGPDTWGVGRDATGRLIELPPRMPTPDPPLVGAIRTPRAAALVAGATTRGVIDTLDIEARGR